MTERQKELRAAAISGLAILDTMPEHEFDVVARLAQQTLKSQMALISLIDKDRQWIKAKVGTSVDEAPIEHSFCAHAVRNDQTLIIPDATADPRFAANPMVVGEPHIRFYAGAPIRTAVPGTSEWVAIGTLCVTDDKPRTMNADEIKVLNNLTLLVEALLRNRAATARAAALAEERQVAIERLDRKQRQFRQAERMANIGSWRLSLSDNSTEWSDQVFAIHGLSVGQQPRLDGALDFFPAHERDHVAAAVQRTVDTGQPFDFEADFVAANGALKKIRSMGEIELSNGLPVAIIGVMQDITERHRMEQDLRRNAIVDELTQLGNRAGCNRAIEEGVAAARETGAPLALLLIDLDGFKQVNDRCGHLVGDDLLRLVGLRLKSVYLANCYVGRLGGDEFIVLATARADCANLNQIVRRLLLDLRQSVPYPGGAEHVSGTIGVAWLDGAVRTPTDLVQRADLALYEAKRENRGSAKIFGQSGHLTAEPASRPNSLQSAA